MMPSLFVYLEKLCRNEGEYRLPSGTTKTEPQATVGKN